MILSGLEIEKNLGNNIIIEPFDKECLNPNSYNIHLANELFKHDSGSIMDMKKDNKLEKITIHETGLVLSPGVLYLGRTVEYTETHGLVPMIEGRSSVGRLGMFIHITAGFGDIGFCGYWTLEITVIEPLRIYPGVAIGQLYYHTVQGESVPYSSSGKYQGNKGVQGSQMWKDFK